MIGPSSITNKEQRVKICAAFGIANENIEGKINWWSMKTLKYRKVSSIYIFETQPCSGSKSRSLFTLGPVFQLSPALFLNWTKNEIGPLRRPSLTGSEIACVSYGVAQCIGAIFSSKEIPDRVPWTICVPHFYILHPPLPSQMMNGRVLRPCINSRMIHRAR